MIIRDTQLKKKDFTSYQNVTYLFIIGEVLTDGRMFRHFTYAPTLGEAKDKITRELGYKVKLKALEKVGPYRTLARGGDE